MKKQVLLNLYVLSGHFKYKYLIIKAKVLENYIKSIILKNNQTTSKVL